MIIMTNTDGQPTTIVETGNEDNFIMIGKFPSMGLPEVTLAHGNGAGGIEPHEANAENLLRLLAEDLGYNLVPKE